MEGVVAGKQAEGALPTGTVTFLLTDIEGSTRLWESTPDEMTSAVPRHYEILDRAIARHGGARPLEQGEGDSVVAAFSTASDAVAAALDVQRLLQDATPGLRVRMAVHTGQAQLRDAQNYVGNTVIRCARLRSCAWGGQVLVSDAAAGLVADRLPDGAGLVDLGVHRLRDLSRPERVWQLAHAGLLAAFPPIRSLDAFRHNLPPASTPLVGRTRELTELRALVLDRRFLTITGSGGVGKTRLAQQVAADLVEEFADGVVWVELAAVTDPAQVSSVVAAAAGLDEIPGVPSVDVLVSSLRHSRSLLVVDNCEHLLAAVAVLLGRLLDEGPGLHVLATSREQIGVDGETTWRAPSLSLPPPHADDAVGRLLTYDAVRLFVERAGQARPNFALTPDNALVVTRICERLDGIPLAIELAAARVRNLPIERLADELDQRFRVLTGGARTVMARQRTLLASIDWSYDLLDPGEAAMLRRLSAFVGGFTLDAAEVACADEHLDAYDVLDVLGRLVDKSLVQLDDGSARYRLLESIRVYAIDQARTAGDLASSRDRHLAWSLQAAAAWDVEHTIPTVALAATVEPEYANLLAALEWSLDDAPAVELLGPLGLIWAARSQFADARQWTERVLDRLSGGSVRWAVAVAHSASAFTAAGGPLFGSEVLASALEAASRAGDAWATARLQLHLACDRTLVDPSAENLELFDRALGLLREVGDEGGVVAALGVAAVLAAVGGRTRRAEAYVRQLERLDLDDYLHAYLRAQGAMLVAYQTGDFGEAVRVIEASVAAAPPAPRAFLLLMLGQISFSTGDLGGLDRAIAAFPPREQLGGFDGWKIVLEGCRALATGDMAAAAAAAVEAHGTGGAGSPSANVSAAAALLAAGTGEYDVARTILAEGAPFDADDAAWIIAATPAIALIGIARGDRETVERQVLRDLEVHKDEGHVPMLLADFEFLACVTDVERAVRLAAAAARGRDETGLRFRAPLVDETLDEVLGVARAELGERFDELWSEGTALGWDEAAAYALRMHGPRDRPSHGWPSLTPTELAAVDLVVEGLTNPQIAKRMMVETSTVKTHLHHVFTKLDIGTRTELVALALEDRDGARDTPSRNDASG
jgi:predicted ATPase/class 3 adenylate cyclase/DNA-binding CsgD family transcriptional regulator